MDITSGAVGYLLYEGLRRGYEAELVGYASLLHGGDIDLDTYRVVSGHAQTAAQRRLETFREVYPDSGAQS